MGCQGSKTAAATETKANKGAEAPTLLTEPAPAPLEGKEPATAAEDTTLAPAIDTIVIEQVEGKEAAPAADAAVLAPAEDATAAGQADGKEPTTAAVETGVAPAKDAIATGQAEGKAPAIAAEETAQAVAQDAVVTEQAAAAPITEVQEGTEVAPLAADNKLDAKPEQQQEATESTVAPEEPVTVVLSADAPQEVVKSVPDAGLSLFGGCLRSCKTTEAEIEVRP